MLSMRAIVDEYLKRVDAGEPCVLGAVVRTRGSTPQKAGALMLVLRNGQTLGTLGGGCVEADVTRRALESMNDGPTLHTFKLDGEITGFDDGLVCGGTMEIATLPAGGDVKTWREAAANFAAGRDAAVSIEAGGETFALRYDVSPPLLIAGAGHVGSALASMAAAAGFAVAVADDRAAAAEPNRFAAAEVICGEIDAILRERVTPASFVVIVTRGHRHDAAALAAVVNANARYVGVIGSRRKIVEIFRGLREAGVSDEALSRVHAPIGLAIGAVTPGEIAASIVAELIAVRRDAPLPARSMRIDPALWTR
jgi:xanthine dehydrogenase accessory factor